MAEAGARVLNAQAVEFAKEKNIAIYARATAQTPPIDIDGGIDGTVVRKFAPRQPGSVAAVVSERDVLVLQARAVPTMDVLRWMEARGICGKQLHATTFQSPHDGSGSDDALSVVLSRENLHEEPDALRQGLDAVAGAGRVDLHEDFGAVSAIGAGINASYRNVLAGTSTLCSAGIVPCGTATSSFRITWLVERAQLDQAVRALHRHYLE